MLRFFLKIIPIPLQLISLRLLVARNINNNHQTKEILRHLEGKEISVWLTDIGRCYCFSVREGFLRINSKERNRSDVAIKGDTATFSGLFMGRLDPDSVFFSRTMKVDGDASILVLFKNLIESIK